MISKLDMKKPLKRRENGTNWIKIGTKWLTRVDVGQTEMGGTDRSIHPLPTKFHKKKQPKKNEKKGKERTKTKTTTAIKETKREKPPKIETKINI